MTKTMELLEEKTFAVQHNPRCAYPYVVRLIRPGAFCLDMRPYNSFTGNHSKDILGFGKTLNQAAVAAFKALHAAEKARKKVACG